MPGGLCTPALGQGEGPAGDKLSRSDDAGNGGRGRNGAKRNGVPPAHPTPSDSVK